MTIGNYDLLEKIAEGGMGSIYRGRHRDKGTIVAVKVMPAHMASNAVLLKRFEQEFRTASRLDHPNVVRALDYGESGDTPYLVMEFVDGESLGAKLEREGRMPEDAAIRVIAQVAQGLHRAHKQNLVHRDVKPDNILVTKDGVAKLADLGLVKETDTELNLTKTGRGLGTPHFMAPEQFRDAKGADVRCDIYSLGATLYQMVTGELPFRSSGPLDAWMKKLQNELTPPRRLVPTLSERTEWAILRAMSADRERRPASCREFVEDLTGQSTRRPPPDTGQPAHDLWYLVYKDENGTMHTVKGSTSAIRRSLREGLLGDASNIRAARTKAGPFEPLRGYPEFRDIVVTPGAVNVAAAAAAPAGRLPAPATAQTPTVNGNGATNGVPPVDDDPEPPLLPAGGSSRVKRLTKPRLLHGAMTPKGAPKIDLDHLSPPPSETAHESLKWVVLILLAAGLSVAAYLIFQG
jgi:serine/threonine protein kinase